MSRSFWIPYLTDNVYRLSGLGTHSDITQLRQAVKRIDSGMRVGITPTLSRMSERREDGSCLSQLFGLLFVIVLIFLCSSCSTSKKPTVSNTQHTTSSTQAGTAEPESLFQQADQLYNQGQYSAAALAYSKAIRAARQESLAVPVEAYYKYGICLEKSKRRSEAIWAYITYIQSTQHGEKFKEAVNALRRLGVVSRPKSGASPLGGGIRSGYSKIVLSNQTGQDAFVKILASVYDKLIQVRNVYVRSGSQVTVSEIPMGQYVIKVAYGEVWDRKNKKFLLNRSFSMSQPFDIIERHTGYSIEYSVTTITLHKVVGGNFAFEPIDESQF